MDRVWVFGPLFFLFSISAIAQIGRDSTQNVGLFAMDTIPASFIKPVDSIAANIDNQLDSLNNIANSISLNNENLQKYTYQLDSLKGVITNRIDSLKTLNLPTSHYTNLLDSIEHLGPLKNVETAQQRVQSLKFRVSGKISKPIDKLNNSLQKKFDLLHKGSGGELSGGLRVPAPDKALSNISTPSLEPLKGASKGLETPLANRTSIPNLDKGIPEINEVSKVEGELGKIDNITGNVQKYSTDARNISKGNLDEVKSLPKVAEQQLSKREEMKGFQGNINAVDQYKKMAGSGNDPKALQNLAKNQLTKLATNHFAGKEKVLQQAMGNVSNYKRRYTEIRSLKDLPKRKPNPMKGKSLIERLVPALTFQVQKSKNLWIDYNPSLGYRITGRLSAGLGWNERTSFIAWNRIKWPERIYGPRSYVEFKAIKGFSLRTDLERMYSFIPPGIANPTADPSHHDWVWNVFVGIKKNYKLSKWVNGDVQFMYNLYHQGTHSQYLSPLNVRFGCELPMKKHSH